MAVQDSAERYVPSEQPRASFLYNPRVRGLAWQIVLTLLVLWVAYAAATNAYENLRQQQIASGFGFLDEVAGFSISQALIPYTSVSSYGRAFIVGLLNTLLVAAIGIVFATLIGFIVGIARLSTNWVIRSLATCYVELIRNIPLLLQLFFWYFAVLASLPSPRNSLDLPFGFFLNTRGLSMPTPVLLPGWRVVVILFLAAVIGAILLGRWSYARQMRTGQQFPSFFAGLGLIVGVTIVALLVTGIPIRFEVPVLQGFNFVGGVAILPELVALLLALSIYTAAFIAEIVRAGILAVSHGQTEAAYSLGLQANPTLRLVVIPQALRVIIPPLTSQYLNLTKNSSLAVAIGYPDLFQVFAGTVLNQTGQAIEVIAITMAVYLTISLTTSAAMNWYNRRIALVER